MKKYTLLCLLCLLCSCTYDPDACLIRNKPVSQDKGLPRSYREAKIKAPIPNPDISKEGEDDRHHSSASEHGSRVV